MKAYVSHLLLIVPGNPTDQPSTRSATASIHVPSTVSEIAD